MKALTAALALLAMTIGAEARADPGHPPVPQLLITSVTVTADNGRRVDVEVAFTFHNPNEAAIAVTAVSSLGGAKAVLVDGSGAPARLTVASGATETIAPPGRKLVITNALRAALDGVGLLVRFQTDTAGEQQMLVRLD